jgi:hypothetical protein
VPGQNGKGEDRGIILDGATALTHVDDALDSPNWIGLGSPDNTGDVVERHLPLAAVEAAAFAAQDQEAIELLPNIQLVDEATSVVLNLTGKSFTLRRTKMSSVRHDDPQGEKQWAMCLTRVLH